LLYVNAKSRVFEVVSRRFESFGIPLVVNQNLIPDDKTTNFVCSGMQQLKSKFSNPDNTKYGSLQSCVRTNDLELVGDGSHLTYFEMLGNFSFGRNDYEESVELWDSILKDLQIPVDYITCHPTQDGHQRLWKSRGYIVRPEQTCEWSDGEIGGFCCEVFVRDLEIGNLVNPLGHSTDVGFGFERLHQVVENKERVDESSLFSSHPSYLVRDHERTLCSFWSQGISPGCKNRSFICRRLLRRLLDQIGPEDKFIFQEWIESERLVREDHLRNAKRCWKRFKDRSPEFWRDTFGLMPEEIKTLAE